MSQYGGEENSQSKIVYNKLSEDFKAKVHIKPIKDRSLKEILLMCSLTVGKGYYNFIKISRLMPEYNFTLVLSGSEDEIKILLPDELPPNLRIFSVQKDVHPLYYNADLVLNLSIPELWIETFGLTLIEAMAYGIPVIAPNVGGPIEFVENDFNGFCLDTNNIDEIISKIRFVLDNENYDRLSQGALKTAEKF